ncbi:MAG: cyclic nucleotide-binding domain-containing protein [Crocinitomix sp.]|nr:cyclic nucleotide-binding domain-containing protein [Crocinitomix sp.]
MKKQVEHMPNCTECSVESKVFCSLSKEEKDMVSANKGNNFYKKGQVIFYEGNHSNGLYCIYKGKVKLTKLGEDGKDQVLRFSKTGDILGYRSSLSEEPYSATATVLEDSHICHLSRDKYIAVMAANPKLSWNTMQVLSKDLKNAEQHLINIAQKTVKERISEALILLHDTFGFKEDDTQTLDVQLSRSEIADIAGTTTETTIRTLANLHKEKLIVLNGKMIKILCLKSLRRSAAIYE